MVQVLKVFTSPHPDLLPLTLSEVLQLLLLCGVECLFIPELPERWGYMYNKKLWKEYGLGVQRDLGSNPALPSVDVYS